MEEKNITLISPSLHVEAMSYVDDIMGAGRQEQIEVLCRNLRQMEIKKKYTFNNANGKSHYMIIKTGNDQEEDVEILVGKRKITRASEYKYLRNQIDERGTVERQIIEVENKSKGMIIGAKKIASYKNIGNMITSALLLIYEKTIIPAITYNLEVWSNWQ